MQTLRNVCSLPLLLVHNRHHTQSSQFIKSDVATLPPSLASIFRALNLIRPPSAKPFPLQLINHITTTPSSTHSGSTSTATQQISAPQPIPPKPPMSSIRAVGALARRASTLRSTPAFSTSRAFTSSQIVRGGDSHGSHYDAPGGWLFGVKPGEKYEKEGWEGPMYWGFCGSIAFAIVAYAFKPDTRYVL